MLDDWHAVADLEQLRQNPDLPADLFGQALTVSLQPGGEARVTRDEDQSVLPTRQKYGFVWTSLGQPARDIIHIPEAFEEDRYIVSGGSFPVRTSGLRVVENFLDMGHFPFVHTGWLGEEPHTEVAPYQVELTDDDEIIATECFFHQPVASPTAEGGIEVEYKYRVYRPYIVALYKTNPLYPDRQDYIVLFIQPTGQETCVVHNMLCYIKEGMTEPDIRWFMQLIFAQDKPILENQIPRRLPLDPRAETPIRADKVAIRYRRWLRDHQVNYGAIPGRMTPAIQEKAMPDLKCEDPVALNLWYAISDLDEVRPGQIRRSVLLEEPIAYTRDDDGKVLCWAHDGKTVSPDAGRSLPVQERYGYFWTSLGEPAAEIFAIPEYAEPDRRNIHAASLGVNVSAPRMVENFLDMGHFPYVHTGILGAEPHTEVKEYFVEVSKERDEILATNCLFWQPMAAVASDGGADVEYVYRVPHPYCSVLYKSSPLDPARMDVIAIFVQPFNQEQVRVHMMLCLLDEGSTDSQIRLFQQTIFGQDKPILENQHPKRLPLDPRAETPIRADKSAIAYRRWLSDKGITYGVIPSAA